MLKKLWRYVWGEPDPDTTLEMMKIIVENQEKSQQAMMSAVTSVIQASEKQGEVLGQYLKLFQSSGDPQAWTEPTPEDASVTEMKEMGFDPTWTEAEQAEWVLANIGRL